MKRSILISMFLGIVLVFANPSYAFSAERASLITIDVDLSNQPLKKIVKLWIPYPISSKHQTVSNISIKGNYHNMGIYTDSFYQTPILYAEWSKRAKSRKLRFSFEVTRKEIRRGMVPSREPCWNPADYGKYLRPTSLGPIGGPVKELSEKITRGKTTVLARARAIYDWVCENMFRDPKTIGCGKGDVCLLLQKPGGKCTDISSVFIALARASGVPAREVFSVRLGKKPQQDVTTWQHCWAEFFLPGYGWVSVDPADVRKMMLVKKLDLKDDKTKYYRDYFWGNIDPYRVVIAHGRDVVLNPAQQGPPLNTFGYPYAEVGGQPIDFYDPSTFVYRITYREQ